MDEEPIFDFAPLKAFLQSRGYKVGNRKPYEPVPPDDVTVDDLRNGTIEFSSDGIFVKCSDGVERQVFLYKKDYHLQQYGLPKFHICKCSVIDEFVNSGGFGQHYVRANAEPVPVIDLDEVDYNQRDKTVTGLQLCKLCKRIIAGYGNINSTEFVEMLKAANKGQQVNEDLERDIFGYTRDWESISKRYREQHKYTCENCGIKIEDDYDKQYVHVHHINGDKLINDESNLKCLCLYCHAHVDNHHYRRLTTGANKILYNSFVARYGEEGFWDVDETEIQRAKQFIMDIYKLKSEYNVTIENHFEGTINNLTINGQ